MSIVSSSSKPVVFDQYGKPVDEWLGRGEVMPHVVSFAAIWNNVSKVYSYRWDEALRHQPENALAMRRDCYIRSLLQERAMPTVNRKWQIVGEDKKDPVQRATARTLTAIVQKMPRFKRFLKYVMEALWYGRYGSQVVWRQRKVEGQDRWCVVRHRPVNGDKIQYRWDGVPAVFINTTARGLYPEELIVGTDRNPALVLAKSEWRRQFVIHQHEVDDADYFEGEMAGAVEGVGLRSMVYWAWWLRDEMLSWAVDFMKKVGSCGFWVFPYEQGNKFSKAQAESNAREAGHATALTMPVTLDGRMGKDLAPIHVAGDTSGIEALQHMISNYFELHIERMIVGQSLSSGGGAGETLGGEGKADFARDTKFQLLHYDADNLAETLTEDLVGPAMHYNFPQFDFQMRWEFIVDDPDKKEKTEAVKTFGPMGMKFKEDEVRELTGMSKPEEDDEVLGGRTPKSASAHDAGNRPGPSEPYRTNVDGVVELYHYDESKHPRRPAGSEGGGQFIPKGEIAEAAADPAKRAELEEGLDEENKDKLDAAIEEERHPANEWKHVGRSESGEHTWRYQGKRITKLVHGDRPFETGPALHDHPEMFEAAAEARKHRGNPARFAEELAKGLPKGRQLTPEDKQRVLAMVLHALPKDKRGNPRFTPKTATGLEVLLTAAVDDDARHIGGTSPFDLDFGTSKPVVTTSGDKLAVFIDGKGFTAKKDSASQDDDSLLAKADGLLGQYQGKPEAHALPMYVGTNLNDANPKKFGMSFVNAFLGKTVSYRAFKPKTDIELTLPKGSDVTVDGQTYEGGKTHRFPAKKAVPPEILAAMPVEALVKSGFDPSKHSLPIYGINLESAMDLTRDEKAMDRFGERIRELASHVNLKSHHRQVLDTVAELKRALVRKGEDVDRTGRGLAHYTGEPYETTDPQAERIHEDVAKHIESLEQTPDEFKPGAMFHAVSTLRAHGTSDAGREHLRVALSSHKSAHAKEILKKLGL